MKLLEDVFIIEQLQVINEGKAGTGPMKVRGIFQRADEANKITKLADAMGERRLLGELDHPQHDSVKLSNVSHLITGLSMKGNEVIGEAEILNTPAGKVAQALIDGGVKIGISSRGMGTVTEELDGKRYVNEDFKLITWDIVADPSTRGAFPGLTESTQIQEIIDTVYPDAQKVKNFTTLLKEELSEAMDALDHATLRHDDIVKRVGKKKAGRGPNPYHYYPEQRPAAKKKAAKRAKPKRPDAPGQKKLPGMENASTKFVNFMRDKLMESRESDASDAREREVGSYNSGDEITASKGPAPSPTIAQKKDMAARKAARIAKQKASYKRSLLASKKYQREYETPQQHSSTKFVNFMRDKLMEDKNKK